MLFLRNLITDSFALVNYLISLNLKTLEYFYLSGLIVLLRCIIKLIFPRFPRYSVAPSSARIQVFFYVPEAFLDYNLQLVPFHCLIFYICDFNYMYAVSSLLISPFNLFLFDPFDFFFYLIFMCRLHSCIPSVPHLAKCISLESSSLLRGFCLFPSFPSRAQSTLFIIFVLFCFSLLHFCF